MKIQDLDLNWPEFFRDNIQKLGDGLVLVAGGALLTVYKLGDLAYEGLRPYFGQDAGEVLFLSATTAVVIVAGTAYLVKKRRGGSGADNDDPDNSRPPFLRRVQSFVSQVQGQTNEGSEAKTTPPAEASPESELALNRLAEALHVFCEAGTGSGKTVLVTDVMRRIVELGGKYYAIDGKPEGHWSKKWPLAAKKIRDPEMFVPALKAAQMDMERRIQHGPAKFPPYVLVLDEASEITGKFEEAENIVSDIARRGRSFGMRVWLLNQASTVMEVGFNGRAGVLESNFTAIKLENENGHRRLYFGKLRSGRVIPYRVSYPIPNLPAPWANLDGLATYDDSGEFNLYNRAVQMPLPAVNGTVQEVVQNGLHRQNGVALPEVGARTDLAPVQAVQVESDKIRKLARWMIESMTDESSYPIGKRFLTVGESSAIFYLNQMEWSQNDIIDFVLGTKNTQRQAAVAGVLEKV